ncbi:DMT family transporter [Kocuria sp.]|uniref:DMT family transporter n=1 Tax=Kocuria sp. TaxID=1871328 RepID=UPI0026DBD336|nr:DMT family transporter [Kocuria sp.]MDO4919398.1 DMT family transporter [Kocuria sp.]
MAAAFVVAWSSGFIGASLADQTAVGVWRLLAWRYLATAAVLLLASFVVPVSRRAVTTVKCSDLLRQIALALLSHVVFLGGVFLAAQQGLDAGLSALVCALQPLLVTAAGRLVFFDRVRVRQWVGLVMALAGVALSVGGISATGLASVGLVVASLLGLSTSALLERAWQPRIPVLLSLTIQVCVAAVVFVLIALHDGGLGIPVTERLLWAITWLVLLSGLGGYMTFTWCLRHLGATTTSTLLYLTAPMTMLWAWFMFAQQPSVMQWTGLLVVLAGVACATKRTAKAASEPR